MVAVLYQRFINVALYLYAKKKTDSVLWVLCESSQWCANLEFNLFCKFSYVGTCESVDPRSSMALNLDLLSHL